MEKILIGIDPDLRKSGICITTNGKITALSVVSFFDVLITIGFHNKMCIVNPVHVYIEAGWLNKKSNFHGDLKHSKSVGERISKNVGQNEAIGKLLAEYCEREGIKFTLVKPDTKKWDANFFKKITGYTERTNSEQRDAARLIFGR